MDDAEAAPFWSEDEAGARHTVPVPTATIPGGSLRPTPFLNDVVRRIEAHFSVNPLFRSQARSRLAKFWFGADASVHYEIWLHERTGQLELGLHFESSSEVNRALYHRFDQCLLEVHAQLGDALWLEEWDHGWARLYETQPLWPLNEGRVGEVAARLCQIIETLQPMYETFAGDMAIDFP